MEKLVFAVYDSKAEAFLAPWVAHRQAEAIRWFQEMVQNPNTPFGKFPEDYTLFCVGTWDETTADLKGFPAKKSVVLGSLLLKERANG